MGQNKQRKRKPRKGRRNEGTVATPPFSSQPHLVQTGAALCMVSQPLCQSYWFRGLSFLGVLHPSGSCILSTSSFTKFP